MNYIGMVFDGRWEVIRKLKANAGKTTRYELKNVYNNNIFLIDERTLKKVVDGETTVSRVITHNIKYKRFCK